MKHSAVVVASLASFVVGGIWYSPLLFGTTYLALRGVDPADVVVAPLGLVGELVRGFVVASVLAVLAARLGVASWAGGMRLGLVVWLGFQAMLLLGAVLHEELPLALYAIHAGDAFAKTVLMGAILGAWRTRRRAGG